MRVGQGVDVHAFSDDRDRPLVLGGLLLPDEQGLSGHSDADVVLHAVVDALLGAAALGDMGTVFGTDEPRYADAPSSVFVQEAVRRVAMAGWSVMSVDVTIIAQRPRIGTHRTRIADAVQTLLGVAPGTVSVKATTTDGLGAIGRGAGMACQAIALLERT
ncbi:MAG: 2-C-methyl-D-erythritol 2,4-cyclodiphosphate synthase [Actinomycetota bacterium]|jgi:2-C-methyl-D-erythritol 2,4-cyclodiphosphate synthase|nr:2-C-methyl-D-erythritol 2,4-cyclodiphosphate synthase [Actinomycetota bacterium]MDQ3530369.1 2-C-methyl-D-erythritol 2,4-cyclodiphosphate synthase [Actinomycetota bacterium]